jgi:murein DD-endopeptidase MepM/ murein hydrolase activator NlpD
MKYILLITVLFAISSQVSAEVKFRYPMDSFIELRSFFDHDIRPKSYSGPFDYLNNTENYKCSTQIRYDGHRGIDYTAKTDYPLSIAIAAAPGKIITVEDACEPFGGYQNNGCGGGFGNHVVFGYDAQTRTAYESMKNTGAHLG